MRARVFVVVHCSNYDKTTQTWRALETEDIDDAPQSDGAAEKLQEQEQK